MDMSWSSAGQFVPHACSRNSQIHDSLSAIVNWPRSFGEYTEKTHWQKQGRRVHELLKTYSISSTLQANRPKQRRGAWSWSSAQLHYSHRTNLLVRNLSQLHPLVAPKHRCTAYIYKTDYPDHQVPGVFNVNSSTTTGSTFTAGPNIVKPPG